MGFSAEHVRVRINWSRHEAVDEITRATPVRGARQGKARGIPMGQFALSSYHYSYFWY
jgi:hypothetical protein